MDYSVDENYRLFMDSWNFWKYSNSFCWRCNFRVDVFFSATFFVSTFSRLFSATIQNYNILAAVGQVPSFFSGFILEVSTFTNLTFFCWSIIMHYLFIHWIGVTVIFLTASYFADWRTMLINDCCLPFYWKKTIGSSVLVTCTSIGVIVPSDILLISSDLAP